MTVNNGMGRWLWLEVLASGAAMFFLLEHALATTGNINYVPSLLAIGTLTLPLSFLIFLYSQDITPRVSIGSLLALVLWGGVLGTVLAGHLEYETILRWGALPTIAVGFIEELAKLLVPAIFILRRKDHSELDSLVMGAAAGAGFAAFESMGYGLVALLASGGNLTATIHVLLLRGLMAPGAHIAWTALAADALWRATHSSGWKAARTIISTFIGVVLLHALWDSQTPLGSGVFLILSFISLTWLMIRLHIASSSHRLELSNT